MTGWIIHEASDVPDSSVVWLSQQHHNQGGTLALAHNKLFTGQLDGNDNNTALEGPPGPEGSDLVSGMQLHRRITHISNSCLSWHLVIQK